VVVSKNVGAKDVVGSGGILVEPGDHEAIMEIVRDLTPQRLEQLRRNIQQECRVVLWEDFLNENDKLYSDSL
jgi:glycosyltransferase involved in cell wall biosynthesis